MMTVAEFTKNAVESGAYGSYMCLTDNITTEFQYEIQSFVSELNVYLCQRHSLKTQKWSALCSVIMDCVEQIMENEGCITYAEARDIAVAIYLDWNNRFEVAEALILEKIKTLIPCKSTADILRSVVEKGLVVKPFNVVHMVMKAGHSSTVAEAIDSAVAKYAMHIAPEEQSENSIVDAFRAVGEIPDDKVHILLEELFCSWQTRPMTEHTVRRFVTHVQNQKV